MGGLFPKLCDLIKTMKRYFIIYDNSGCIREINVNYKENDFVEEVTLESSQACAERCASIEGGLFWTFFNETKTCHVKNSTSPRRGGSWDTLSGNRECGLSNMTMGGTQLVPLQVVASQEDNGFPLNQCADSKTTTFCAVAASPAPWLALDFGSKVRVERVDIRATKSFATLKDFEVRVTDSLPSSGSYSFCVPCMSLFSGEDMFREGALLGSYVGTAANWQRFSIMSPLPGPTPEGRYVLLQKNNDQALHVVEFKAFGGNNIDGLILILRF